MEPTEATEPTVKVWDPFVRVFHWSLVAGVALAWLTGDELERVHEWTGYFIAALLAARVIWGVAGSRYARFMQFVRPYRELRAYATETLQGREKRYIGHNPMGGWMIIALILTLSGTALTGWMTTTDAFWGIEWVEDLHEGLANTILLLVALHVGGVVFASLRHGENLARAMLNGRKRSPEPSDIV
ncbi:cytochrome b/b6 domain-containing protein [Sneathiella chinensis]|uniref:Cytochrome b561 n=1 Tax=Sneathiella chinensis TaxID=349750 RepID=A0ABQ5UA00_9PROT|nr:cytochrome b/b6 domain-containing protein [Sneathiella chinensis]GLQ07998.1 cytochrome b561 [Sneathiella chinensis]